MSENRILDVKIEIEKPSVPSPYGNWKLLKIDPDKLSETYKGNIKKQIGRAAPYTIQGGEDIFDKDLFINVFLKLGVYHLDWIPKEGTIADEMWKVSSNTKKLIKASDFFKNYHTQDGWQHFDWNMALADYINSTISPIPPFIMTINNNSNKQIKIIAFYTKTVFTTGGEASPGAAYIPPKSKTHLLTLHWNKDSKMLLKAPLVIDLKSKMLLPISSYVKKAAQGDGPGRLVYALYVDYNLDGKEYTQLLTLISQSEDYGLNTGW